MVSIFKLLYLDAFPIIDPLLLREEETTHKKYICFAAKLKKGGQYYKF